MSYLPPHHKRTNNFSLFSFFFFQFPRQHQYWWCQNFHNLAPQICFIYFIISFYKILNISDFILAFSEHLVCASLSMRLWFFFFFKSAPIALFMSHKQCNRCWFKKKKKNRKCMGRDAQTNRSLNAKIRQ